MISARRWLLGAAAVAVGVAGFGAFTAFAMLFTESLPQAVVAACLICGSGWLHIVLHECGHFLVALILRLPVVAVRIAPFTGRRNEVVVRPDPDAAGLPLRMVLFLLAGPTTNLATAALLGVAGAEAETAMLSAAMIGAAWVGALIGVVNLVPWVSPPRDGSRMLRWLRAPATRRADLRAANYYAEVVQAVQSIVAPGGEAGDDTWRALDAYRQQWVTGDQLQTGDLIAGAQRLVALAHAEGTDPRTIATIGQALTVQFGLWYVYAAVVSGAPVPWSEVVEIAEIAELAWAQPDTMPTRVAMSLAHLLNGRPETAWSLLADLRPGDQPDDLYDLALILRTIADAYLHDRAEPEPTTTATSGRYPQLARIATTTHQAATKPPLSQPAPTADQPSHP